MPDDLVAGLQLDPHSAVVALTHDAKLDDMARLEALKSPAFYVGALGSRRNTARRKERLALFDLSAAEIDRLHRPIGLHLGSRTPAEIAMAILAEIVAVRHGVQLVQKKSGSTLPSDGLARLNAQRSRRPDPRSTRRAGTASRHHFIILASASAFSCVALASACAFSCVALASALQVFCASPFIGRQCALAAL